MSRVGDLKVIGYEFKGLCKMGVAQPQAPGWVPLVNNTSYESDVS